MDGLLICVTALTARWATKHGWGREKWLHSSPQSLIHLPQIHPPHSPHPTTIGWCDEMCVCHLLLRTIKSHQIGVYEGSNLPPPSQHVSMLGLLTQIVPGDLHMVDHWLIASDECTSARNRYETLPPCKGEPPRQFLGRIPPHTHLQVCSFYVKPPT